MKQSTCEIVKDLAYRYPNLNICESSLLQAIQTSIDSYLHGGQLLICGNGGSAADSLHIVGELMKAFILPRNLPASLAEQIRVVSPDTAQYLIDHLQQALPAISLVSEVGLSTAYSNDMAPDLGFAQQVLGYGRKGDVLLAISTSGNSSNIIYAAQMAKVKGINVIGLTGISDGKLTDWADVLIKVPSSETYRIQEYHLPIYHTYCLALENEFYGE